MATTTYKDMTVKVSFTGHVDITCRNLMLKDISHEDLAKLVYPAVSAAADAALPAPPPPPPSGKV